MITKAWVQDLLGVNKIHPTACVIRGHCRTRVFAFPKNQFKAPEAVHDDGCGRIREAAA